MTILTVTHDPIVEPLPRIGLSPAELTVTCTGCDWRFESQESISGGVEPWGEYFEDHVAAVQCEEEA